MEVDARNPEWVWKRSDVPVGESTYIDYHLFDRTTDRQLRASIYEYNIYGTAGSITRYTYASEKRQRTPLWLPVIGGERYRWHYPTVKSCCADLADAMEWAENEIQQQQTNES